MMRRSDSALDNRKQLGGWGEDLAADYLMSLGWVVTDRNWRCSVGEIDLPCLEPCRGDLPNGVIVEVKCRSGTGFGDPLEAITYAMARRIAANPGQALRMTKRLMREAQTSRLDAILELSAAYQALTHGSAEHEGAVAAFLERRKG